MDTVDPLIWFSLFAIVLSAIGFVGAQIVKWRFDRKYGRSWR